MRKKWVNLTLKTDMKFRSLLETQLHLNENEFFLSSAIEEIDKIMMKL